MQKLIATLLVVMALAACGPGAGRANSDSSTETAERIKAAAVLSGPYADRSYDDAEASRGAAFGN